MKKLIRILCATLAISLLPVSSALADAEAGLTIKSIFIRDGYAFLVADRELGNRPQCHTTQSNSKNWAGVDLSTPHGQAVYKAALAAKLSGAKVSLLASNKEDCLYIGYTGFRSITWFSAD